MRQPQAFRVKALREIPASGTRETFDIQIERSRMVEVSLKTLPHRPTVRILTPH